MKQIQGKLVLLRVAGVIRVTDGLSYRGSTVYRFCGSRTRQIIGAV